MTPRTLIDAQTLILRDVGLENPKEDAAVLLAHILRRPWLELLLDRETPVAEQEEAAYRALCARRAQRVPLQYLTGVQSFCGRLFHVDERVLIPRPETEELAQRCLSHLKRHPGADVLDLCCGSGILGVTLALDAPEAHVVCSDILEGALTVTADNAERLGARVTCAQGDLFQAVGNQVFDLIVSNPPYIPRALCRELQPEVLREPVLALDGGEDGLDFYRRIAAEALRHLRENGVLLLEIGWDQGGTVPGILRDSGFSRVNVFQDIQGKDRIVEAQQ